ncbi:LacI family DNA-binding transcriptional regulator [Nocardioides sp. URHA0020]|uniref:LacI family DNA-binding transcriptional regulator n=1 Tax=Nocardioides sp. URHA0020 TaxID=1380392 RepID=UPI00048C76E3|nr:LacI family DNA-binding transcriptional regulator [Nocardioides sp. URHA0020]
MTSIKDVARDVEMSTATISRALRGLQGVSAETRERVLESAHRLGYVPSPSAAGLASGQTRTVAVIVPRVTQWFFAAIVQGAEEVLRERGYDLLLYNLAGDASARHRVFETSLLTKRVDAVLVLSLKPSVDELQRLSVLGRPVTIIGADMPGWATVRIDDHEAAATATGHLLGLGHTRIGYIGGATEGVLDFTAPSARLTGYRCTLERAGVQHEPDLEADGEFTVSGGLRAGHALLSRADRPTAIFAASDEMAIGALRAARELGLRVPEDVSVIGIDDHEMASYFDLTTVAQPVHEQGRVAATQVLAALTGGDWRPEQVILPTELVVRGSTAAIVPRRARRRGR